MNTPIIDLQELLEEVQDMIEEKIAIEGGNQNESTNTRNSESATTFSTYPITKKNGTKCCIDKAKHSMLMPMSGTKPTTTARSLELSAYALSAAELNVLREVKTMKIYLVLFQYCTDDCDGVDTQAYSTYEKAVERFNEIIENEKNTDMSWAGNAFENDKLQHNYELDCNETFTDGEEHELWWNLSCKLDWYLHEFLELRILEVDSNEL